MRRASTSLAILIAVSAASAVASENEMPLGRAPSEMSGDEIDAYNQGRMATDANYIRCRRIEQVGSLVKKLRVCNTNAEWRRITDKGNQDARDSMAWIERGFSNSREDKNDIQPAIRPQ
jgi:hypothetical protein